MKTADANRTEIFSKKFLVVLLILSIITNGILIVRQQFPNVLAGMQVALLPAPKVLSTDHVRGKQDAKYTLIEYADFQCPFCAQFHQSMNTLMKETDIRWVYRHFPLNNHSLARRAAEASECAGEQGKFWEYSDALFGLKDELTNETLVTVARRLGLDAPSFEKCLGAGTYTSAIAGQVESGMKMRITGTPTLYLNGTRFDGFVPLEVLRTLVRVKAAN
jgi:protein-disulfide isomerase